MIDGNLLFWLEVCALTILVGVGIWRIYRTLQSARINPSALLAASAPVASAPVAYDMRRDGQRLSLQTDPR